MIEKIKDYLYFDENREGEQDGFSMINVYPYLNINRSEVSLLDDEKRAVEYSHHSKKLKYIICVRSREAMAELDSVLTSEGFLTKEIENCGLNLNSSDLKDFKISVVRRWFNMSTNDISIARDIITSKSGLALKVQVDLEDLRNFKNVIFSLRDRKSYRNLWKDGEKFIVG